jgi:hypothetical protein
LSTRFVAIIAAVAALTGCSPRGSALPGTAELPATWPPATGTVVAQSPYGRVTSLGDGGYSIELRESPLPPERSEAQRDGAIATIRHFAEAPDLSLTYGGIERHPENSGMAVELYASPDAQFMVDIQTDSVVYMQPSVGPMRGTTGDSLSPSQLQERATAFLVRANACFEERSSQLQFQPGNKGDNYFFRWQSPEPNADRPWNQPAFVQISIDAFGTIFGYVDSGICYLQEN